MEREAKEERSQKKEKETLPGWAGIGFPEKNITYVGSKGWKGILWANRLNKQKVLDRRISLSKAWRNRRTGPVQTTGLLEHVKFVMARRYPNKIWMRSGIVSVVKSKNAESGLLVSCIRSLQILFTGPTLDKIREWASVDKQKRNCKHHLTSQYLDNRKEKEWVKESDRHGQWYPRNQVMRKSNPL